MNTELWEKTEQFNLDYPIAEYGFSTRLANENAWTKNFTQKAITEYKKFMYLAATSDYMVSPSEIVDVVWHQHLIFTQSYNEFCTLLGKTIQHIPSTHNRDEAEKFKRAKERTKKLYNEAFGEQPAEIWEYDSMLDALGLPKLNTKIDVGIVTGIFLFLLAAFPCYYLLKPLYISINNLGFLIGYISVIILVLVVLQAYNKYYYKKLVTGWPAHSFIHNLTPFELVYLKTGKLSNVVHCVVNEFIKSDKIAIDKNKALRLNYFKAAEDEESYAVLESVKNLEPVAYPVLLWRTEHTAVFLNIANSMKAFKKYTINSKAFGRLFYSNFIVLLLVLMLGFVRLLTGIMRDKPVVFIAIILLAAVLAIIAFLFNVAVIISSSTIPGLYKTNAIVPYSNNTGDYDWQYFIIGNSILSPAFLPLVSIAENRNAGSSSSDGGGSSCGSGDGGGGSCGGGGCGGCGGGH